MEKTILIVEDENSILSFLSLNLRKNGYQVIETSSGEEALIQFQKKQVDLVILDLMLPGMDGYEVSKRLKAQNPMVGIIMLTARTFEEDKVKGLLEGADDYMVKPFVMKELLARIVSLFRRMNLSEQADPVQTKITTNSFTLDIRGKQIFYHEVRIEVTSTEYALLELFMKNKNKAFDRNELLDIIWGETYVGDPKVVDVNIRRIRKKIEQDPSNPLYLVTIRGQGYCWRDDV